MAEGGLKNGRWKGSKCLKKKGVSAEHDFGVTRLEEGAEDAKAGPKQRRNAEPGADRAETGFGEREEVSEGLETGLGEREEVFEGLETGFGEGKRGFGERKLVSERAEEVSETGKMVLGTMKLVSIAWEEVLETRKMVSERRKLVLVGRNWFWRQEN